MLQNEYQRRILSNIRSDQRTYGMKFYVLTGAGYSALDAYKKQTYSKIETLFSGAYAWKSTHEKRDSQGGFFDTSDIVIIASRDYKSIAQTKDVQVEIDNILMRVNRIVDCEDTEEIVIYAERLE